MGDVEEVVKAEGQPLEFKVRLLPQKGSSAGTGYGEKVPTFVVLNVCIPLDYPKRFVLRSAETIFEWNWNQLFHLNRFFK